MMFYDILGSSYVHSTLLRFNLIQPDVVVDISENLQGRPHGGSDTRGWLDLTQALVEFIADILEYLDKEIKSNQVVTKEGLLDKTWRLKLKMLKKKPTKIFSCLKTNYLGL